MIGCSTGTNEQPQQKQHAKSGFALLGLFSPNTISILDPFLSLNVNKTTILWRSFGDDPTSFDTWLQTGQHHTVEIHPFNGAGRRNERLGSSDFLPSLSIEEFNHALEFRTRNVEIRLWLAEITRFAFERPNVRWILSLGLESNYTPLAAMNLLHLVLDEWPYEIAYNPLDPLDCDYMPDIVHCETHSIPITNEHPRCIVSNDGVEFSSKEEALDFIERNKNCIVFLWSGETQGISNPFVPTLDRQFRFDNVDFFRQILDGHTLQ